MEGVEVVKNCPCKECVDRKVGCHSVCGKYKAFTETQRKKNECIRKQKEALSEYLDMKQEGVKRAKRRMRNGK